MQVHGIPQSLRQLFNSSMSANWRIAQPYCVALAPAPKSFKLADPLWYAGCKTLSGEDKLCKLRQAASLVQPLLYKIWLVLRYANQYDENRQSY